MTTTVKFHEKEYYKLNTIFLKYASEEFEGNIPRESLIDAVAEIFVDVSEEELYDFMSRESI